ncbi:MAG: short-chain dehydrogenase [Legionellales bacterium]|nr:short-chain dehydrogenase [Legionellales bacterium]
MNKNGYQDSPSLNELFSLNDKFALVIGGAGLLGSQISNAFAELGANVIVASRDISKCQEFVKHLNEIYPDGMHLALEVDITDGDSMKNIVKEVEVKTNGGLDILVNSGWSGRKNTFDSISNDDWDNDIDVCLSGVFRVIKLFVPLLKKNEGNILNIASMYGHVAPDYRLYDSEKLSNPPSYGAAKAGIIQFTKYLSSFLSSDNIRVNCISPGPFPYESTQKENPDFISKLAAKNPLNRIGKPYELKGAAVLLCSNAGSYMTGQNICVDGGWTIW